MIVAGKHVIEALTPFGIIEFQCRRKLSDNNRKVFSIMSSSSSSSFGTSGSSLTASSSPSSSACYPSTSSSSSSSSSSSFASSLSPSIAACSSSTDNKLAEESYDENRICLLPSQGGGGGGGGGGRGIFSAADRRSHQEKEEGEGTLDILSLLAGRRRGIITINGDHHPDGGIIPNHECWQDCPNDVECSICFKRATRFCSLCEKAYYCSAECQWVHWDQHSKRCSRLN